MQPEPRPEPFETGVLRWFYGGEVLPDPTDPESAPRPPAPPPDRVREPDDQRQAPVREPMHPVSHDNTGQAREARPAMHAL